MANIMLTMAEIETLFHSITTLILGYTVAANPDKVRIGWNTAGAPTFKITDNVTFLMVTPTPNDFTKLQNVSFDTFYTTSANQKIKATRHYNVAWTVYGPAAFENIELIRYGIFKQYYHDLAAVKNIYVIPEMNMPRRNPDLFNGQWWNRYDFNINFYEGIEINETIGAITSASIIFKDGD